MAETKAKCIHCNSDNVSKMGLRIRASNAMYAEAQHVVAALFSSIPIMAVFPALKRKSLTWRSTEVVSGIPPECWELAKVRSLRP